MHYSRFRSIKNFCKVSYLIGGSPISFSGSGIWFIIRPGFGILKETEEEVRDCNYERGTGFGDFNKRKSGIPDTEICNENQAVISAHLIKVGNSRTMT